ncbi:MAG: hypothetical protein WC764_03865 [Candidatus Paceibacterota bacterium]|jgi:hypothetical protein
MKAKAPSTKKYLTEKKFGIFQSTFDKAMTGIAKSFAGIHQLLAEHGRMHASHTKSFELIMTELKTIHTDNQHFKQTMSAMQRDLTGHDRQLDNHEIRIEKLEVHA